MSRYPYDGDKAAVTTFATRLRKPYKCSDCRYVGLDSMSVHIHILVVHGSESAATIQQRAVAR